MFVPYQEYKFGSPFKDPLFPRKTFPDQYEALNFYKRPLNNDIQQYNFQYSTYGIPKKTYERFKVLLPIPKGSTAYAQAKRAEYVEKNLGKAEQYYRMAIENNERLESAIKDLATVLHQQGKTEEACRFLEEHKHLCTKNQTKFENLLTNLKKQIVPSGNYVNRTLVLFNLPDNFDELKVKSLFGNSSRINQIEFRQDYDVDILIQEYTGDDAPEIMFRRLALLQFSSNSAARKTLETLKDSIYQFYWMNVEGMLTNKAEVIKKPREIKPRSLMRKESELSSGYNGYGERNSVNLSFESDSFSSPLMDIPEGKEECWESLVFPSVPKDAEDLTNSEERNYFFEESAFFDQYRDSKSCYRSKQPLLNQVRARFLEIRSMISEDPDFVKKLLLKVIAESDYKCKPMIAQKVGPENNMLLQSN